MENIQQIENWIETIESSNLPEKDQEQMIMSLVDLWKFASCHKNPLKMGEAPNLLLHEKEGIWEQIHVQCENLYIDRNENISKKIFQEIEEELSSNVQKYGGVYRLQMNKTSLLYNEEMINEIKQEIIAAIKGEVILYKHVLSLHKTPGEKVEIIGLNFTILECTQHVIHERIKKHSYDLSLLKNGKKWLVFFLNTLENDCHSFSFQQELIENSFVCDFDEIYLFDFYKGEMIQLNTKKSQVKIKILTSKVK